MSTGRWAAKLRGCSEWVKRRAKASSLIVSRGSSRAAPGMALPVWSTGHNFPLRGNLVVGQCGRPWCPQPARTGRRHWVGERPQGSRLPSFAQRADGATLAAATADLSENFTAALRFSIVNYFSGIGPVLIRLAACGRRNRDRSVEKLSGLFTIFAVRTHIGFGPCARSAMQVIDKKALCNTSRLYGTIHALASVRYKHVCLSG